MKIFASPANYPVCWSRDVFVCYHEHMVSLLAMIACLALLLANAFFVASEFAMVKMRPTRLEYLASLGQRRARVARQMSGDLAKYLSANQLGITISSLALG